MSGSRVEPASASHLTRGVNLGALGWAARNAESRMPNAGKIPDSSSVCQAQRTLGCEQALASCARLATP